MAINYTYPVKGQPVIEDEFLIVDTQDGNATKRVTVDSILDLGSGGDIGVSTFQATDGTFINYSPNGATTGTVTLTGDLSATGTAGATNFLRGDNTWSTAIREVNPTIGDPIVVSSLNGIATLSLGTVPTTKGGTGLTTIGTRGQVISVNSGGTLSFDDSKIIETVRADETIAQGDPLYIVSSVGGVVSVGRAMANNQAKMPSIGVATTSIANNSTGTMHVVGLLPIDNMNTLLPGATSNAKVYVGASGGLTLTKPTGTNLIQNIGIVSKPTGAGFIQITAIGRSNDVPNIPSSQVWVGSSTGVATPRAFSGEVSLSDTGVTAVTSIAGNVSIRGYSPIVKKSDAIFSISTDEAGKTILFTNGGVVAVNITDSAEYPVGSEVHLVNFEALGSIEVAAGVGTALAGGTEITSAYGKGTLKKESSGNWVLFGQVS